MVAFFYRLLPPKTIPEGHLKSEGHFQPEVHQTRSPPSQKAITEGHTPGEQTTPPEQTTPWSRHPPPGGRHPLPQSRPPEAYTPREQTPPRSRHPPSETCCKACWDSTHPPVNRITDTSKNITLATTSLRPVIKKSLGENPIFNIAGFRTRNGNSNCCLRRHIYVSQN